MWFDVYYPNNFSYATVTECLDKGQCEKFATKEVCEDATNLKRMKWIQEKCPKTCGICGKWYDVNRWWIEVINLMLFIYLNLKHLFGISNHRVVE